MNTKYKIKIHSFVDLITNSSTEIFIEATSHTIDAVKDIVNNILKLGGNDTLTADDLFEFELEPSDWGSDVSLIVKSKDENSELGLATAKMLANLSGIFEMDAEANY